MKILLHICCAPCSIHPFEDLAKDKVSLSGFFYNPNIHPFQEYNSRRRALEEYSASTGMEVFFPEYKPEAYFRKISYNENAPARCRLCWEDRMEKTALHAKDKGFDAFSTTLLISPYQDHAVIREIGEELAAKHGMDFFYRDFRTGFRHSQDQARQKQIYRQKYCGCIFSEMERYK
ncbi:MAG: epoxyqueuosine reductase QueH [Candidatus Omnitrophota bacterium]